MLLATGSFAVVQALTTPEQFQAFGWRIPFLASAVLVVIGILIRSGIADAPAFRELQAADRLEQAPLREVLRSHRRALLITIGLRLAQPGLFAILAIYLISYLEHRRDDSTSGVTAVLIGSALGLISGPLWGAASDRWGRRPIALAAIVGIAVFIWPFFA